MIKADIISKVKSNRGYKCLIRCKNCGKEKWVLYYNVKRGLAIVCSKKCSNIWRKGKKNYKNRGKNNSFWKGGKFKCRLGYVMIKKPEHPLSNSGGYIYEHRLIAEEKMGRPLKKRERIHHWNGIRDDNRKGNLHIFRHQSAHQRLHRFASRHNINIEKLKFYA